MRAKHSCLGFFSMFVETNVAFSLFETEFLGKADSRRIVVFPSTMANRTLFCLNRFSSSLYRFLSTPLFCML
jgi:hypothetical protein